MRTRVLVVDDCVAIRSVIRGALMKPLASAGIDVEEEESAHEAFVRVTSDPGDRWFIVTDYQMPSVNGHPIRDGMDFIRRIRGHVPDIRAHIIFMTGTSVPKEELATLGADRCFEKPMTLSLIVEELLSFLASE